MNNFIKIKINSNLEDMKELLIKAENEARQLEETLVKIKEFNLKISFE